MSHRIFIRLGPIPVSTPSANGALQNASSPNTGSSSTASDTANAGSGVQAPVRPQPKDPTRLGNFCVGSRIQEPPLNCLQNFICRRNLSEDFFVVKTLILKSEGEIGTVDDLRGKSLFQAEQEVLQILKNVEGVVQLHGTFTDVTVDEFTNEEGIKIKYETKRSSLVLDCYAGNGFHQRYANLITLQNHVVKHKKLAETEALPIFRKCLQIVERIHSENVVHRDLKLGNFVLDRVSASGDVTDVTLVNFMFAKHFSGGQEHLADLSGSPAYIAPEIVIRAAGQPFLAKPTDMWAMGVILFAILYGTFPFNHTLLLHLKRLSTLLIPSDPRVSPKTIELIKKLLEVDPRKRLTATEALKMLTDSMPREESDNSDPQVVPSGHSGAERPRKRSRLET